MWRKEQFRVNFNHSFLNFLFFPGETTSPVLSLWSALCELGNFRNKWDKMGKLCYLDSAITGKSIRTGWDNCIMKKVVACDYSVDCWQVDKTHMHCTGAHYHPVRSALSHSSEQMSAHNNFIITICCILDAYFHRSVKHYNMWTTHVCMSSRPSNQSTTASRRDGRARSGEHHQPARTATIITSSPARLNWQKYVMFATCYCLNAILITIRLKTNQTRLWKNISYVKIRYDNALLLDQLASHWKANTKLT
jgi:hypothetical protein